MHASYLSFIPPDMGNPPSHKTGTVRHDWGSGNCSFHHRRPGFLVLWPLVLGLQPVLFLHATVPSTLSGEGKKLPYSRCLSEVAITRHRRSWTSLGALRRTIELRLSSLFLYVLVLKSRHFLWGTSHVPGLFITTTDDLQYLYMSL